MSWWVPADILGVKAENVHVQRQGLLGERMGGLRSNTGSGISFDAVTEGLFRTVRFLWVLYGFVQVG